jgi:predicted negative regulator of RcsB-dependent stress response
MAKHLDLEEQEQLDQLKHFWNKWGSLISSLIVVVAGSVAAWNGYQYWQNRQSGQAAALFESVEAALRSGDQARMSQAFEDIRGRYPRTVQAAQAGLAVAKAMVDAGKLDGAKDALNWVAENAGDDGLKAIAQLRLASVLLDQKDYDEALKHLSAKIPVEFEGAFADRRGDIFVLQEKRPEAIAEYTKAYKRIDEKIEYRGLVEVKLAALGASPVAATTEASLPVQGVRR